MDPRGYFGVCVERPKYGENVGTLWRTAHAMGASLICTIGARYQQQASDTTKAWCHLPFLFYETLDQMVVGMARGCALIGVELDAAAVPLRRFSHPERAIYLLGAEDVGLSSAARSRCDVLVQIPGRYCLNVAAAGSIVIAHRVMQRERVHSVLARNDQERATTT